MVVSYQGHNLSCKLHTRDIIRPFPSYNGYKIPMINLMTRFPPYACRNAKKYYGRDPDAKSRAKPKARPGGDVETAKPKKPRKAKTA